MMSNRPMKQRSRPVPRLPRHARSRHTRPAGSTLIEMLMLLTITGTLMLFTVRVLHMATQVHESGIRTATHLRLVMSLEDRLRGDLRQAREVSSPSDTSLRLVLRDSTEVIYQLTQSNLIERLVGNGQAGRVPVANQRWLFAFDLRMATELKPTDERTLVRVRWRHLNQDSSDRMLRNIEVSEVTDAR